MKTIEKNETNRIKELQNTHLEPIPTKAVRLTIQRMQLTVQGTSPFIMHKFSDRSLQQMLMKHTGKASGGKPFKDPVQCFIDSFHILPDGSGPAVPSIMFKAAAVAAANDADLVGTEMRRAFHVEGDYLPLLAPPLKVPLTKEDIEYGDRLKKYHGWGASMRCDFARNETGVADIRFRAQFPIWRVNIPIEYNANLLSLEQITALFNAAGFGVGVGDWRPLSKKSKAGTFGRFTVV